jgi:hypothetical protein
MNATTIDPINDTIRRRLAVTGSPLRSRARREPCAGIRGRHEHDEVGVGIGIGVSIGNRGKTMLLLFEMISDSTPNPISTPTPMARRIRRYAGQAKATPSGSDRLL